MLDRATWRALLAVGLPLAAATLLPFVWGLVVVSAVFLACRSLFPKATHQHLVAAQALQGVVLTALLSPVQRRLQPHGPPTPGAREISARWLTRVMQGRFPEMRAAGIRVAGCSRDSFDDNRGLSGTMLKFQVTYEAADGSPLQEVPRAFPRHLMLKQCGGSVTARYESTISGHYREALFHRDLPEFSRQLSGLDVVWSNSNQFLGQWALLSECIAEPSLQLNTVFGNQNWGVPEAAKRIMDSRADAPSQLAAMQAMFQRAALLHASHWCDPTLLRGGLSGVSSGSAAASPWIKAWPWYAGKGVAQWSVGFESAVRGWDRRNAEVHYDPRILTLMDHALNRSSFSAMVEHLRSSGDPFVLIHGDFHAGNALWRLGERGPDPQRDGLVLVDWSEVGVWQPCADLSQFLISDVRAEVRRQHERDLVELYHRTLLQSYRDLAKQRPPPDDQLPAHPRIKRLPIEEFTMERCWELYVRGGVERWLWLFPVLAGWTGLPKEFIQYLHDQLLAFVVDHDVGSEIFIRSVGTVEM